MKLTTEKETEIIEAYKSFWVANLSANMEVFGSYLVDDFSIIGSAKGEPFFSRKETIAFYSATADELKDKAELRNRIMSIQPIDENTVIIHELTDLYVLIENDWTFYGHARISCVMKKMEGAWKAVHQHASFPDHRTEEGQQLAAEKIEKENLELKEAVERRTVELKHKNRELEIEAALERVRSRSMAMHKSEELKDVIQVVFEQFIHVNIPVEHTGFIIDYKHRDDMHIWLADQYASPFEINIPYFDSPHWNSFVAAKENGEHFFTNLLNFDQKNKFYSDLFKLIPALPEDSQKELFNKPGLAISTVLLDYVGLYMESFSSIPFTEEENKTLVRFGKVFEQTYTRFLDLQKAELQTKEAQIEMALEKVRSRTMAMQHSNELAATASVLFQQIKELGFQTWSCGFCTWQKKDMAELWMGADSGGLLPPMHIPYKEEITHLDVYNAALAGATSHHKIWEGAALEQHYAFLKTIPSVKEAMDLLEASGLSMPEKQCYYVGFFEQGYLLLITKEPNNELKDLSIRFAKVFEQTYTRFLDLQKAEQQTRLAQIELAVERVRAKALAMHSSKQIGEVVATLRNEMLGLEIQGVVAATIYLQEEGGYIRMWDLSSVIEMHDGFHVALDIKFKLEDTDPGLYMRRVWNNKEPYFIEKQEADDMVITLEWLRQYNPEQADEVQHFLAGSGWKYLLHPTIQLAHGKMSVDIFDIPAPAEMESILVKMGAAFDLAYKRFIDLQRSEMQMREAQVELSLERVRARTMAMQHSDELLETATQLFRQIEVLGAPAWNCSFNIWQEDKKRASAWNGTKNGFGRPFTTNSSEDVFSRFFEADQKGEELYVEEIGGPALKQHYDYLATVPGVSQTMKELKDAGIELPLYQVFNIAYFSQGYLMFITFEPVPQLWDVFKRFAKVFEQAYTRFLDLQKAEAQARESQIQLALERVRAKTMAMQKSEELADAAAVLFQQVKNLGIETYTSGFNIWEEQQGNLVSWMANPLGIMNPPFVMPAQEYRQHQRLYEAWKNGSDFLEEDLTGNKITEHYKYLRSFPLMETAFAKAEEAGIKTPDRQVHNAVFFSHGYILFVTLELQPEHKELFKRFGQVFQQTYTRFLDLQKSEAQTREARIEMALEKVRSRTMAMQKSAELADASFVLDSQVRELGIQTRGCAFNIYEDNGSAEWFSSEMGAMPAYKTPRESLFLRYYEAGKNGELIHIEKFEGAACAAHYEYLCSLPGIGDGLNAMIAAGGSLPTHQVDHAVYFKYGYVLFITADEVPEAHDIFLRFAKVFEQTYTRFLDLQKAEAQALRAEQDVLEIKKARQKAEEALVNLQAAQKQLVQSEKMASLGELTAGIAHEIQNPLNFVNNFSELSKELLDEMKAAFENGDTADAMDIAGDVMANLEKINHHGKRADAIVKGMLQHSQSSTGKKEPTDINAICDEYLRLSYLGLRSKDNSFNATIKTEFDESIGNINIIPQDIGRVLLNLFNNAFYAVKETTDNRRPTTDSNYQPTVSVSTKKIGDKIEVRVSDNGSGIPPTIVDKIFQPFFTTKPTGQGTGLGLSLSYDIIKAQAGEIKVESIENEGTTFIIQLPIV